MMSEPRADALAVLIVSGAMCLASPIAAPDNSLCLGCHGNKGFALPAADGQMRSLHVIRDKFESSVHGKQLCVGCYKDITDIPHGKAGNIKVSCVSSKVSRPHMQISQPGKQWNPAN